MDSAFSTPCQLRAMWLCFQEKALYNEVTVKYYHMMIVWMALVGDRTHLSCSWILLPSVLLYFKFCWKACLCNEVAYPIQPRHHNAKLHGGWRNPIWIGQSFRSSKGSPQMTQRKPYVILRKVLSFLSPCSHDFLKARRQEYSHFLPSSFAETML